MDDGQYDYFSQESKILQYVLFIDLTVFEAGVQKQSSLHLKNVYVHVQG